jgi:uncharacterized protein (TIGR02118 family)
MIKFSVMYPSTPGGRFDHDYYRDKHMPLVQERMGKYLKAYAIERGVSGGAPGQPAAYVVIGNLLCESMEDFRAGFRPHAKELQADMTNYTDIAPTVQFSEIIVG